MEKKTFHATSGRNFSNVKSRRTKRAVDLWDSEAFTSIFLALGFSYSQVLSRPAHKPLTQTVS